MNQHLIVAFAALGIAACASSSPDGGREAADGGAANPSPAPSTPGPSTPGQPGQPGPDGGAGTTPPKPLPPTPVGEGYAFGTLMVLGDSISDNGGEAPFYYDLLHANDDARYPAWKGHDFSTRYPGITYVHAAKAGAQTALYADQAVDFWIPTLTDQVKGLGHSYPGDVAVMITIGGNDLNAHALDAIQDRDADDRKQLGTFLHTVLAELTTPARLGSGRVAVVQTNVYDATGGKGNWDVGKCGPNAKVDTPVDQRIFGGWNQVIADAASAAVSDRVLDLHTLFADHGFNAAENWFASDCLHPRAVGHAQIRREAWRLFTGEALTP